MYEPTPTLTQTETPRYRVLSARLIPASPLVTSRPCVCSRARAPERAPERASERARPRPTRTRLVGRDTHPEIYEIAVI
jgi:hypothetical protein